MGGAAGGYHAAMIATYLNDHLAGATVGVELARRARGENEGSELGALLAELTAEIEQDRETLREVMAALGVGPDRLKQSLAWGGEKLGRLKPNGSVFSYSPLSRLVELEALALGVSGKAAAWRLLGELGDPRLAEFDFAALAVRADHQLERLEPRRLEAGREALR